MLGQIDLTSIILALVTIAGGCGWLFDRRKHRQEIESLKADIRRKDMDLGRDYVSEFRHNIAEPLQREVRELRDEIDRLRNAIQKINFCAYRDHCPVCDELQRQQEGNDHQAG